MLGRGRRHAVHAASICRRRSQAPRRSDEMYTPTVEDYLKTIWTLQQSEVPVSTSRIAERLGVSAASVTAMVKRLAEGNLLRHEPYYGVHLTPAGELGGLRVIRRHRILELFLAEVLGYEWDRVHHEAERLEHAASDELIEHLARLLDHPKRDPHGSAIPTADGEVDPVVYPTLADAAPGEEGRVVGMRVQESAQLRYLDSLDLCLGARVEVVERPTFQGPVSLTVNGALRVVPWVLAEQVCIAPTENREGEPTTPAGQPGFIPDEGR